MGQPNIFFIGPASVGKTTTARVLAAKLGRKFVDIDFRFCEQIMLIPKYIDAYGYARYCEANSALVDRLLIEYSSDTVFATPSGFLAHEDSPHLIEKHLGVIGTGISVLLLPAVDPLRGVDLVVARQVARWPEVDPEDERQRYLRRFNLYKDQGDIKIIAHRAPELVADEIITKLKTHHNKPESG